MKCDPKRKIVFGVMVMLMMLIELRTVFEGIEGMMSDSVKGG